MVVALAVILAIRLTSNDDDTAAVTRDRSTTSTTDVARSDDTTTVPGATTLPAGPKPTKSLTQALLTKGDLPDGWTATGRSSTTAQLCPGQDPNAGVRAKAADGAGFSQSDAGPYISNIVQEFRDVKSAQAFVAAARAAVGACARYSQSGIDFRITLGAAPDVRDESFGADLVGTGETAHVVGRILYARAGARVATVAFFANGTGLDTSAAADALVAVAKRL